MLGKFAGLGVDLSVSFCRKSSIAHIFRKTRESPRLSQRGNIGVGNPRPPPKATRFLNLTGKDCLGKGSRPNWESGSPVFVEGGEVGGVRGWISSPVETLASLNMIMPEWR
jgi:hypothetical protein